MLVEGKKERVGQITLEHSNLKKHTRVYDN